MKVILHIDSKIGLHGDSESFLCGCHKLPCQHVCDQDQDTQE